MNDTVHFVCSYIFVTMCIWLCKHSVRFKQLKRKKTTQLSMNKIIKICWIIPTYRSNDLLFTLKNQLTIYVETILNLNLYDKRRENI
jgi:hypothetical protein